jgi:hypothetical protein
MCFHIVSHMTFGVFAGQRVNYLLLPLLRGGGDESAMASQSRLLDRVMAGIGEHHGCSSLLCPSR